MACSERAARDDQLAAGEDRRGPGEVQRVGSGELSLPRMLSFQRSFPVTRSSA